MFGSHQNRYGSGRRDFYYANVGRHNFYYVSKCITYFGVKLGSTSPCWNQLVSTDPLSLFPLPTSHENSLHECVECRHPAACERWLKPPPLFPVHVWLFTYSKTTSNNLTNSIPLLSPFLDRGLRVGNNLPSVLPRVSVGMWELKSGCV